MFDDYPSDRLLTVLEQILMMLFPNIKGGGVMLSIILLIILLVIMIVACLITAFALGNKYTLGIKLVIFGGFLVFLISPI